MCSRGEAEADKMRKQQEEEATDIDQTMAEIGKELAKTAAEEKARVVSDSE